MSFTKPFERLHIPFESYERGKNIIIKPQHGDPMSHGRSVNSILYFGSPHNKIVTCFGSTIRFWDSENSQFLKNLDSVHASEVRHMIKLTNDVFLSCSNDRTVQSYSISTMCPEVKKSVRTKESGWRMIKLMNNLVAVRCFSTELLILQWGQSPKILKTYRVGRFGAFAPLLLSRLDPCSFYVGIRDQEETVKLVDYGKDEVTKMFRGHSKFDEIHNLNLFFNSNGEEILLLMYQSKRIYYYNTSHPSFETNIKIKPMDRVDPIPQKVMPRPRDLIISSFCLNNQYLVCGDNDGRVHLFEITDEHFPIKRISTQYVHSSWVFGIKYAPTDEENRRTEIRVVTCSSDRLIKISWISGVKLKMKKKPNRSEMEIQDLNERVQFLQLEVETFSIDHNSTLVMHIKVKNMELIVPKLFLLFQV